MSFVQMDELLRAIIDRLVNDVCERRGGQLALNRWQLFCLRMWWSGSGRPREPAVEERGSLAPDDARRLFEHCIRVVRYTYHPEIDSFTIGEQVPVPWAPPPPSPWIAPGSGILYHVARTRRPYRTRMIHVDLRTQNAVDDVRRGIGDVMYCCAEDPRSASSDIIALSAPVPGLLDGLPLDTFEEMIRTGGSAHAPPMPDPVAPARVHLRFDRDPGEALLRALVSACSRRPSSWGHG